MMGAHLFVYSLALSLYYLGLSIRFVSADTLPSIPSPSILPRTSFPNVFVPDVGAQWPINSQQAVWWTTDNAVGGSQGAIVLAVSDGSGLTNVATLANNVDMTKGVWDVRVPNVPLGSDYNILIDGNWATASGDFSIIAEIPSSLPPVISNDPSTASKSTQQTSKTTAANTSKSQGSSAAPSSPSSSNTPNGQNQSQGSSTSTSGASTLPITPSSTTTSSPNPSGSPSASNTTTLLEPTEAAPTGAVFLDDPAKIFASVQNDESHQSFVRWHWHLLGWALLWTFAFLH